MTPFTQLASWISTAFRSTSKPIKATYGRGECRGILFLDFDGVVTAINRIWVVDHNNHGISRESVMLIADLIRKYKLRVVITSVWRGDFEDAKSASSALTLLGLPSYCAYEGDHRTDHSKHGEKRGTQIDAWLAKHPEYVDKYIIVDDDHDMLPHQMPFFIPVDGMEGFCFKQHQQATELLDKQQESVVDKSKQQQPLSMKWKVGLVTIATVLYTLTVLAVSH